MSDDEGQEPLRPEPEFRVFVHGSGGTVDVTHAVMDVYDIAVNSVDFGSGFLSTEEAGNLRALGAAIGAERFDYQHDSCLRCGHKYGFPGHQGASDRPCCVHGCSCPGFVRSEGTVL